jgi:hypothetical protein
LASVSGTARDQMQLRHISGFFLGGKSNFKIGHIGYSGQKGFTKP